jgi:peptide/nickel transport system permease protein
MDASKVSADTVRKDSAFRFVLYSIRRSPLAIIGIFFILSVIVIAVFAPYVATHDPNKTAVKEILQPPSASHILGTDDVGRDVFSRLVYGSRISLQVAFTVVTIASVLGTLLGAVSGYFGGVVDSIIMRIVDIFLSVPPLVLAIVAVSVLGPSLVNVMLGLALVWWTWYARLVRGEVLRLKESQFVLALHSLGCSDFRIIFAHIIPNCMGVILVQTTMQLGLSILYAAGINFLGIGARPPTPSWGLMISVGHMYLPYAWWMSVFPGLMIFVLVMGFMLLGDSLRDILAREA